MTPEQIAAIRARVDRILAVVGNATPCGLVIDDGVLMTSDVVLLAEEATALLAALEGAAQAREAALLAVLDKAGVPRNWDRMRPGETHAIGDPMTLLDRLKMLADRAADLEQTRQGLARIYEVNEAFHWRLVDLFDKDVRGVSPLHYLEEQITTLRAQLAAAEEERDTTPIDEAWLRAEGWQLKTRGYGEETWLLNDRWLYFHGEHCENEAARGWALNGIKLATRGHLRSLLHILIDATLSPAGGAK